MLLPLSFDTPPPAELILSTTTGILSWLIRHELNADWSHAAIVMRPTVLSYRPVLFESVATRDPCTRKDGLRYFQCDDCPDGLSLPDNYAARACRISLPVAREQTDRMFDFAVMHLPFVRYAPLQLLSNWFSCCSGLLLARLTPSPYRWTCSEAVARILPRRLAVSALNIGTYRYDDIAPAGTVLPSLETAFK